MKSNTLGFQELPLFLIVGIVLGKGNFSYRIDNTVPRNIEALRNIVKRVTNEASVAREFAEFGNLAVGGNCATRNLLDDFPNPRVRLR